MAKEKRKSPLKDNPLRNPGQSLGEEINTLLDDKILAHLWYIVFFAVLTMLEWLRWYNETPYNPILYSVMLVPLILFSTYKLWKHTQELKKLKLGRRGEIIVGQELEKLREHGYRIFHDIIDDNKTFNIDHIIICKHGVFSIETKTYSKSTSHHSKIVIDNEDVIIDGCHNNKIITQAKAQAKWLQDMLFKSTGKNIKVKPVVVFPGWWIDNSKANKNLGVEFLNPKMLLYYISKEKKTLSTDLVMQFDDRLSRYIPPS